MRCTPLSPPWDYMDLDPPGLGRLVLLEELYHIHAHRGMRARVTIIHTR